MEDRHNAILQCLEEGGSHLQRATLGGTGQNPRRCNGAHNGEDLPSWLLEHRLRGQHPGDSKGTVAHSALLEAGAIALDFNLAEEQLK